MLFAELLLDLTPRCAVRAGGPTLQVGWAAASFVAGLCPVTGWVKQAGGLAGQPAEAGMPREGDLAGPFAGRVREKVW
jgi:hypothetical protein